MAARMHLFVIAMVFLAGATGPALGGSIGEGLSEIPADQKTPGNESVLHEHPDDLESVDNLPAVRGWLAGRLAEQLTDSTVTLSRSNYSMARQHLGPEYKRLLENYVDVAGETASDEDDRKGDEFEEVAETQVRFIYSLQAYRQTYDRYQTARDSGDEARSRELARRLNRQARRINQSGTRIVNGYDSISNGSTVDLNDARTQIRNITRTVRTRQVGINHDLFVVTQVEASLKPRRISYTSPGWIRGRLTDNMDRPLADRHITVRVGSQLMTVSTDGNGEFSTRYRPTNVPVGDQMVTVQYVPENASVYLGSRTAVKATIEQVSPTIRLDDTPAEVAFREGGPVSGRITVRGRGVTGIPVVVLIAGTTVGKTVTGTDGTFTEPIEIPASVPNGSRTLRVVLPYDDRALEGVSAETPIVVRSTPTSLTVDAVVTERRTVTINGTLSTVNGMPVGSQQIRLLSTNKTVGTVPTNVTGGFSTTVVIPPRVVGSEPTTVLIKAVYAGTGTNLEPTMATTSVDVAPIPSSDGISGLGEELQYRREQLERLNERYTLVYPLAVLLLVGLWFLGRKYWRQWQSHPTDDGGTETRPIGPQPTPDTSSGLSFEQLREALHNEQSNEAVMAAYAIIRGRLANRMEVSEPQTHWEFYSTCRDDGFDSEVVEDLYRITTAYEEAAFSDRDLEVEEAATIVNDVEAWVDRAV